MKFLFRLFMMAFVVIAVADYCTEGPFSWRQKLTVEVETPDGVKIAESVGKVHVTTNPPWAFGGGGHIGGLTFPSFKGEAPFVKLEHERYLFALLANEAWRATSVIHEDNSKMSGVKRYAAIEAMGPSAPFVVSRKNWPRFVTFKDINDPSSVQAVDKDNLAATFGEGYRIKSVTLQITNERMTCGGIKKILPWLDDYYDKMLDGRTIHTIEAENRFANSLGPGSFATVRSCGFFSGWLN
jgi:hypothetical protein